MVSRPRREGITLIEVVIAAMILVIGLLSFFAVFLNCTRLDETSKESIIAMNHARIQMERLRAMNFAGIKNIQPANNNNTFDVSTDLLPITEDADMGTITVDTTNDALLDVTVTVRWAGITGDRELNLRARFVELN